MQRALALLMVIASPEAQADDRVREAERAFAAARFEEARAAFHALEGDARLSAAALGTVHRYLVAIELLFGDDSAARAHADAAAALLEAPTAPEGADPLVARLLGEAGAQRGRSPLALQLDLQESPTAGARVPVRAALRNAPVLLIGEIELSCRVGRGAESSARMAGTLVSLEIATAGGRPGQLLSCGARARAPGGALLQEVRRATQLVGMARTAIVRGPPRAAADGSGSPWPWIGLGAGAAAAGVALAIVLTSHSGSVDLGPVTLAGRD